jgi:putative membrane protein
MMGLMRRAPLKAIVCLAAILVCASMAAAQGPVDSGASAGFDLKADLIGPVILSVVFTVIGLLLFGVCLVVVVKIAPFSVRKEIEEDQNVALGIIIGCMILGIAIILAAALLG